MIPRLKPSLGKKEIFAALNLPRKDDVIRFEIKFAQLMDQKYALAFPYGRTGLMLLLKALDIKDKEIICPAYTCVVVPHAIVNSGNTPIFVDCEPEGFNMDMEKVDEVITEKTGALIATSIFGYPVNLDKLDKIRKDYPQVHIIQDCAHSFAAKWKGRPVQKDGIAALFGLNISKLLTSIFGGMITTDDQVLYSKLKQVRNNVLRPASWKKSIQRLIYLFAVYPTFSEGCYGIINRLERAGFLDQFVKYYDEFNIDMPGDYLEAMANVEARVGIANLSRYPDVIRNRISAAKHYFDALQNSPDLKLPSIVAGATYSHFAVEVKNRDIWLQKGLNRNVQLGWVINYCIPLMQVYGGHLKEEFPEAAEYAETIINLPVWGGKDLAERVCNAIL